MTQQTITGEAADSDATNDTLANYGAVDHSPESQLKADRDHRTETGASDDFADDRATNPKADPGKQSQLFPSDDEHQRTLAGDSAANQCTFEK